MHKIIMAISLAAFTLTAAPALAERHDDRRGAKEHRKAEKHDRKDRREAWRDYRRYDYNHPDPRYGRYEADRYYRADNAYKPRRLSSNDRIYRGSNGRYYCRRDDGTTGLIIGGIGGGVLGNVIAPGDSKTLGTILGAGLGAVVGRSIDRDNVVCR